jgi:hypothetical protein
VVGAVAGAVKKASKFSVSRQFKPDPDPASKNHPRAVTIEELREITGGEIMLFPAEWIDKYFNSARLAQRRAAAAPRGCAPRLHVQHAPPARAAFSSCSVRRCAAR